MKELDEHGRELFDGKPVTAYGFKFTGEVVLGPEEGAAIASGDRVTFIVTADAKSFTVKEFKDSEEVKRINTFKLDNVVPVDYDRARKLYEAIGQELLDVDEETFSTHKLQQDFEEQQGALL